MWRQYCRNCNDVTSHRCAKGDTSYASLTLPYCLSCEGSCVRCTAIRDIDAFNVQDHRGLAGVCDACIDAEDSPSFDDDGLTALIWGCVLVLFFALCYFAGRLF